jgi:hypothetical protein
MYGGTYFFNNQEGNHMKINLKGLMVTASLVLSICAPSAWATDYDLTACHTVAMSQKSYACKQTNNADTSACKGEMTKATESTSTSACWASVSKFYTLQNSKLRNCIRQAVELYAQSGGNSSTNSAVYKELMEAYKDTSPEGASCQIHYGNANVAWSKIKGASAVAASNSEASRATPKLNLTDCSKVLSTAKAICEKDMGRRVECNKTANPGACYNAK